MPVTSFGFEDPNESLLLQSDFAMNFVSMCSRVEYKGNEKL